MLESTNPSQPTYASGTLSDATGLTLPSITQHTATFGDTPSAVHDADLNECASDTYSSAQTTDDDHHCMEETQTSTLAAEKPRCYY
ncbi:hypothetical protein AAVH_09699 [Aphelenchoides avenae]|nr:hypothetical protein AAVH_09699 [Aphelenchus avenae]